ncbi:TIGR01459 family HAD-type hydrolase [Niveispirillum lacus]|uniref:TIGR01459 family HAD-type hydrolase n=1 Tax=Niveispirillum lacus TaxID=1981099 RepID=A0A255Z4K4_9PROT|nr:TIGR01459 family HAD-type hydrolase [Niveispirillum lacus]OYQ35844.1 TIGR01459 family HAD-type hydrolase [Niveispirillum lacus]
MTAPVPLISGLANIADRYDGFILDLWGVVHDGVRPYEGVVECLSILRRLGKRVCLLSNAPRRIAAAAAKLSGMGVGPDLYDALYTSGEASFEALRDRNDEWHAALGPKLFHIGPPRDNDVYDSLKNRFRVDSPEDADFVINTGIDAYEETLDDYAPILRRCLDRGLPMLCANPDLVVVIDQELVICAGELARHYETLGGDVRYHGKPHAPVYRRCFELLGGIAPSRILAVGDSLRTDVAGANAAGIDSLLITGGIHREELGTPLGVLPGPENLADLLSRSAHRPTWAAAGLRWA